MTISNATTIKRQILFRLAELFFKEKITDDISKIPYEIAPNHQQSFRCCVHRDRIIIKYRIIAALGIIPDEEINEEIFLRDYYLQTFDRNKQTSPWIFSIKEACSGCVETKYFVTNACRGCVSRNCVRNCPKQCISIQARKAVIDQKQCLNCGKCKSVCSYNAIVYVPVPCEEACPVHAIEKNSNGKVIIDFEKCVQCGNCLKECPFGSIVEKSQLMDVLHCLKQKKQMVAIVAPAIAKQFKAPLLKILGAIKKAGFTDVVEAAYGAEITAQLEAAELLGKIAKKEFLITSCCSSYYEFIKKHVPEAAAYLSSAKSPMEYTAEAVKKYYPDAVIVFISPCLAKKSEAERIKIIDYVLNFEEVEAIIKAQKTNIQDCSDYESEKFIPSKEGRNFPMIGGVSKAVEKYAKTKIENILVEGINKKNQIQLREYAKKGCKANLIEVMACKGGCIGGCNTL